MGREHALLEVREIALMETNAQLTIVTRIQTAVNIKTNKPGPTVGLQETVLQTHAMDARLSSILLMDMIHAMVQATV